MARKLKSDKLLFIATLLLVCTSIVMVYSASALVALERYQQPYYFVTRQAMWAALGFAVLSVVMRVDYRTYRNERLIWILTGGVTFLLLAVLFSPPINGTRRWFGRAQLAVAKRLLFELLVRLLQLFLLLFQPLLGSLQLARLLLQLAVLLLQVLLLVLQLLRQ